MYFIREGQSFLCGSLFSSSGVWLLDWPQVALWPGLACSTWKEDDFLSTGMSYLFSEHQGPVGSCRQCPILGPQNNVVKHSQMSNIRVGVSWRADSVWLPFVWLILSFMCSFHSWLNLTSFWHISQFHFLLWTLNVGHHTHCTCTCTATQTHQKYELKHGNLSRVSHVQQDMILVAFYSAQ